MLLPAVILYLVLQSCRVMYDLPGESGTVIDLFDDDDLEMMWDELNSILVNK